MTTEELQEAIIKFREYLIANGIDDPQIIVGHNTPDGGVDGQGFAKLSNIVRMLLSVVANDHGLKLVPK